MKRWLAAVLAVVLYTGCASGPSRIAHVSILSLGGAVVALNDESVRVYRARTDALIASLADAGGDYAAYTAQSRALTEAFRARRDALVALDAAVYTAAGINDAVRSGARPADYAALAVTLLGAIDVSLHVLRDGRVLPALHIPTEITQVVDGLTALATAATGGNHSDAG